MQVVNHMSPPLILWKLSGSTSSEGIGTESQAYLCKGYYMFVWTGQWNQGTRSSHHCCAFSAGAGKKDQNLLVTDIAEVISRVKNEFLKR